MKKIMSRFGLLIVFIVICGGSYLLDSILFLSQGETFIFLTWIVIIFFALFVYLGVITKNCKKCKLLFVLWMLIMFGVALASSWAATKIFNIDFKVAFILITLGAALKDVFSINKDENKEIKEKKIEVKEENDNYNNLRRRR